MQDNNKTGGKLYSMLKNSSKHEQTILEIESALGIDRNFPAGEELVSELLYLITYIKGCSVQKKWYEALKEIEPIPESCEDEDEDDFFAFTFETVTTSSWRFPAKKKELTKFLKAYPLPAFFLQNLRPILVTQSDIIRAIWLIALFQEAPKKELNKSAELLRKALNDPVNQDNEHSYINIKMFHTQLPYKDFHRLDEHIATIRINLNSTPEEKNTEVIAALRWLIEFTPQIGSGNIVEDLPKDEVATEKPKKIKYKDARQRIIEGQPVAGEVNTHRINRSKSIDNEPPELISIFSTSTEEIIKKNSVENELDTPESEIEQQVQESRYWLTRHEKIVPADYGRFTLAERMRVAQFINDGLNCSDINRALAAGLIGTIYVTGLPLEDLYQAGFGSNQTFMKGGIYRREIRLAQDAFSPSQTQINHISPFATELSFQLPEPVAKWLDSLSITSSTLSESLSIELDDARKLIHAELEVLRNNGCFQRIRAERIPAALAIETTLMFRDPLITFLLASKPTQAAPKLSYYVTHPVEKLSQYYEQVTNQMVNPWIN